MEPRKASTIVVGVDGTPAGTAALEFAVREGRARGCTVEVVTAWDWTGPYESVAAAGSADEARARAQNLQNDVVTAVLRRTAVAPLVSRQVVRGAPAQVLLRVARGADYLVVGTGHKGPVKRAVLGSVSGYCVRHATCPVVVVPAPLEASAHGALTARAG